MEFVVNKREFVKALSRVQSVADKRSPMPILTNVLIRAEASGAVHFAATDLLLAVTGTMRADVKKAGSVALPAPGFRLSSRSPTMRRASASWPKESVRGDMPGC